MTTVAKRKRDVNNGATAKPPREPGRHERPVATTQDAASNVRTSIHAAIDAMASEITDPEVRTRTVGPLLDALDQLNWLDGELEHLLDGYEKLGGDDALERQVGAS